MFDAVKIGIAAFFSALIAYLQPVVVPITILLHLYIGAVALGVIADWRVNNKGMSFKKLCISLCIFAAYCIILVGVYTIGNELGDREEALVVIKTLTYVLIYFYGASILKNLHNIFPHDKALSFLDYWFGLEFTKRIPGLGGFLKNEKDETTE